MTTYTTGDGSSTYQIPTNASGPDELMKSPLTNLFLRKT